MLAESNGVRSYTDKLADEDYSRTKCPACHKETEGYMNVGRGHWIVCDRCQIRHWIGENLFSCWKDENRAIWKENVKLLLKYRVFGPHDDPGSVELSEYLVADAPEASPSDASEEMPF